MADKVKIVAIVGSMRRESYNRQLAMQAKEILGDKAELEILDYADVPLMNQDIEYPAPEPVCRVREAIKASDGVWFFCPEYNHYFSGALKNLIDWLSRPISESEPQVLDGKPAAISGASLGMSGTKTAQDHLVALISLLNMNVMNKPRLAIPNIAQQTDPGGRLSLCESAPWLKDQAQKFVEFINNA
ncbi:MAG: NAD(P)H-dependent oxidoreductase [Oscillospiraceae bacterium]|nr:NAD(P)H-dependent oxidoreductase [Oscillospiraceae bacterium]